jgi:hypothetical protein
VALSSSIHMPTIQEGVPRPIRIGGTIVVAGARSSRATIAIGKYIGPRRSGAEAPGALVASGKDFDQLRIP